MTFKGEIKLKLKSDSVIHTSVKPRESTDKPIIGRALIVQLPPISIKGHFFVRQEDFRSIMLINLQIIGA